jgi:hypothetical protein
LHRSVDVLVRSGRLLFLFTVLALAWGCASSRSGSVGQLTNREALVTLVVTEDRQVVQQECRNIFAAGNLLGCRIARVVPLPDGRDARAVTIVRYTDSLPSKLAFEIEVHELCHAIASLQSIDDPCHIGNNGILAAETSARVR